MHSGLFFSITSLAFLITSCSHSIFNNRKKPEESAEWAQKAIFEYLKQPNPLLYILTGKGLIKLDPSLYRREEIRINGKGVHFKLSLRQPERQFEMYPFSAFYLHVWSTGEIDDETEIVDRSIHPYTLANVG